MVTWALIICDISTFLATKNFNQVLRFFIIFKKDISFKIKFSIKDNCHLKLFSSDFFPRFFLKTQIFLHLLPWHASGSQHMTPIVVGTLISVDHYEDIGE